MKFESQNNGYLPDQEDLIEEDLSVLESEKETENLKQETSEDENGESSLEELSKNIDSLKEAISLAEERDDETAVLYLEDQIRTAEKQKKIVEIDQKLVSLKKEARQAEKSEDGNLLSQIESKIYSLEDQKRDFENFSSESKENNEQEEDVPNEDILPIEGFKTNTDEIISENENIIANNESKEDINQQQEDQSESSEPQLEVKESIEEEIESKEENKQEEFKSEKVSVEKLSIGDVAYSAGQERINEWKNNIKIMFGGVGEKVSNILEKTKRYSVMAIGAPESIKYTKEVLESKSQEIQDKVEKAISEFTDKMRNGIEQRRDNFIQSVEDFKNKINSLREDALSKAVGLASEAAIAGLDWGSKVEDVLQKIYEIPAVVDSTKAEIQQYIAIFQQVKFNMASMSLNERIGTLGQNYFEMELQPIIEARDSARKRSEELKQMSRNRLISSKRKFGNLKAIAYGLKVYKKAA